MPETTQDDGRKGKVFCLRLAEDDRKRLEQLRKEAESSHLIPWLYDRRRGSLGGFLVWAALEWKPDGGKGTAAAAGAASKPRRRRPAGRRRRPGHTKPIAAPKGRGKKGRKKGGRK